MPKSVISASSPAPTITLAGFRSRCTTPAACAATSPAQMRRAMRSALRTGTRPSRASSVARSVPST